MLLNFFANLAQNKQIDIHILSQLFMGSVHDMKGYDYKHTSIRECDIAFHLDFINPIGLHTARLNILITSLVPKVEILGDYLHKIDYVLCKTREAEDYFGKIKSAYGFKLKFLGWTAFDKLNNEDFHLKTVRQYYTFVNPETPLDLLLPLIEQWPIANKLQIYSSLPHNSPVILDLITSDRADYFETADHTKANAKDSVFIHINHQPFDYELLGEASTGSVLITDNIDLASSSKGQFIYRDLPTLLGQIRWVDSLSDSAFSTSSQGARDIFINNQRDFLETFTKIFLRIFQPRMAGNISVEPIPIPLQVEKPLVSIITPTYNRPDIFRIARFVWNSLTYENREWIIIDDSPTPMEWDFTTDPRIRYCYIGPDKKPIGAKRNLAVSKATGEYIMCMDDDDFYPAQTIEIRLAQLHSKPDKQCSYASTIACYNIYRKFSYINTPSIYDPPHKRVSEATLFFKRSFWEQRGFPDEVQLGEGENFIEGRYNQCLEVDWHGAIISLIHTTNISKKFEPDGEPNGNHFMNEDWGMKDDFIKLLEDRF